jgi:hypothetical protein
LTEGLTALRALYDAEYLLATSPFTFRDPAAGDVSCKRYPIFHRIVTYGEYTKNNFKDAPPQGTKGRTQYYSGREDPQYVYNAGTKVCTAQGSILTHGYPSDLGLAPGYSGGGGAVSWIDGSSMSYFIPRAVEDSGVAAAYGVSDVKDTITVFEIADLDGDFTPNLGWSSLPYSKTNLTILGRSMYYKDGKVNGVAGVVQENVGE